MRFVCAPAPAGAVGGKGVNAITAIKVRRCKLNR